MKDIQKYLIKSVQWSLRYSPDKSCLWTNGRMDKVNSIDTPNFLQRVSRNNISIKREYQQVIDASQIASNQGTTL
jgi:hypothetical protein